MKAHEADLEAAGRCSCARSRRSKAELSAEIDLIIGIATPSYLHEPSRDRGERGKVIGLQERRLGPTVLRTYRTKVDIDDVVPNERQPRLGPKEDDELQRQIEANEGLFEPLLVEPHPDLPDKFRIIDGERRWTNSRILVGAGPGAVSANSGRGHRPDAD